MAAAAGCGAVAAGVAEDPKRPRISSTLLFCAAGGAAADADGVEELPKMSARRSCVVCADGAG
jgi:hypothetical protein